MNLQARHVLFLRLDAAGLDKTRRGKLGADMGTPVTLKNLVIHKLGGIDYDKDSDFVDDLRDPKYMYHYTSFLDNKDERMSGYER